MQPSLVLFFYFVRRFIRLIRTKTCQTDQIIVRSAFPIKTYLHPSCISWWVAYRSLMTYSRVDLFQGVPVSSICSSMAIVEQYCIEQTIGKTSLAASIVHQWFRWHTLRCADLFHGWVHTELSPQTRRRELHADVRNILFPRRSWSRYPVDHREKHSLVQLQTDWPFCQRSSADTDAYGPD